MFGVRKTREVEGEKVRDKSSSPAICDSRSHGIYDPGFRMHGKSGNIIYETT